MGIDAVYLDETQKRLFVVQSKCHENGKDAVSQREMHSFVEEIRRGISFGTIGANARIQAKKTDS